MVVHESKDFHETGYKFERISLMKMSGVHKT